MELLFWLAMGLVIVTTLKILWNGISFYWLYRRGDALEGRIEVLERRSPSGGIQTPPSFKPLPEPPPRPFIEPPRFIDYTALTASVRSVRVAE